MSRIVFVLCSVAVLAGCARSQSAPKGSIKVSAQASPHLATTDGTAPQVCATFTLQPYSLDSSGNQTLAGAPITINSVPASQTDTIAGCIAGPTDGDNDNWGYLVTATDFVDCSGGPNNGHSISGLSPSIVTGNYPVDCQAGIDVSLPIVVDVSIATPNNAGYIDISVGVNSSEVQVGCKQADIGRADHMLHFGESNISAGVETGLVALDTGAPIQFGGTVNDPSSSNIDTYYTGEITPSSVGTIYQTFLNPCTSTQEYADIDHAQCVSDNSGVAGSTVAELADAFAEMPGQGFAAVSVASGGLLIYSSMGSSGPATMSAGSSFTPGYNPLSIRNILSSDPSIDLVTITGVFVDQGTPMQFLIAATAQDGTPVFATLSYDVTAWTVSGFFAVTPGVLSCNGLYANPASCFVPGSSASCQGGNNLRTRPPTPINPPHLLTYNLSAIYDGPAAWQSQVVVANAGEPNLTLTGLPNHTTFAFANKLPAGASYHVTVVSTPPGVTCVIPNPSGTMPSANRTVSVECGPSSWQQVAAGNSSGDGIAADGSLWAWGCIFYGGTLGTGGPLGSYCLVPPVQIGTDTDWTQVAAGGADTFAAIKSGGTLWAWGNPNWDSQTNGSLGDGTSNAALAPEQIGTDNHWSQVALTCDSTSALKTDGTLWHWGTNDSNGSLYSNVPEQVGTDTDWASITGSCADLLLLKQNHSAWAWGNNFPGSAPVQIGAGSQWVSEAASGDGDADVFLIKSDGTLWAMGQNYSGELGDGTTNPATALEQIGSSSTWVSVASSYDDTTAAINANGDLYVWGNNDQGQIGNGTTAASASPVYIGTGYGSVVQGSADVSYALKTDHSLWAWGLDVQDELGHDGYTQVKTPMLSP